MRGANDKTYFITKGKNYDTFHFKYIKNGTYFGNHDKIFTRFIVYMLIGIRDDSDDVTKTSLYER